MAAAQGGLAFFLPKPHALCAQDIVWSPSLDGRLISYDVEQHAAAERLACPECSRQATSLKQGVQMSTFMYVPCLGPELCSFGIPALLGCVCRSGELLAALKRLVQTSESLASVLGSVPSLGVLALLGCVCRGVELLGLLLLFQLLLRLAHLHVARPPELVIQAPTVGQQNVHRSVACSQAPGQTDGGIFRLARWLPGIRRHMSNHILPDTWWAIALNSQG